MRENGSRPTREVLILVCRRKPGTRCPSCQQRALESIQGRLERTVANLADATGVRRARLEADARDLARQVACRRADLYSTAKFQRETLAELAHVIEQNPKDPQISTLAGQLVEGRVMERYRQEQAAAMPPLPEDPAAQPYHVQLGDARFDMAHARLRMDMSGSQPQEWQEWQSRHHDAAQRAALAQARMDAVQCGGTGGWESLTPDEQRRRRDAAAEHPSLTTPVVPRKWEDVVDETQDLIEGVRPARAAVDDVGYRPYGDDGLHPSAPAEPATTGEDDDTGTRERAAGRADLAKQARRRDRRRAGARGVWRSLQADRRRVASTMRTIDRHTDNLTPDMKIDGSVFDLTLLSYLTEKMTSR